MKSTTRSSKEMLYPDNNPSARIDAEYHLMMNALRTRPGASSDREIWAEFTASVPRMTRGEVVMALRKSGPDVADREKAILRMLRLESPGKDVAAGIRRIARISIEDEIAVLEPVEKRIDDLRRALAAETRRADAARRKI